MFDEGGMGEAVALAQCAVGVDNLLDRFLEILHQFIGEHILYYREAVRFNTLLRGVQFVESELITIAQIGLLDVAVVHSVLRHFQDCPALTR